MTRPENDASSAAVSQTPRRALFGPLASVGIAAALIGPLALITFTGHEPYPAVLFPGGGSIATHLTGSEATFYTSSLVGQSIDAGEEVVIDRTRFLDPIPSSHLGALVGTRFGQDVSASQSIEVRKTPLVFEVTRHVPSDEQREVAHEWLVDRLLTLGLKPDELMIRTERVTVDHSTGAEISREVVEEVDLLD